MKSTNYKNLALAGITAAVLTACSSGGTCGTCAIPVPAGSKLIFVAPSILPSLANTTGINYMGVYNPTTTAISNISYSLGQAVGTGSSVTLDPASAKACANIAAKSSCFLKLSVPESTIAGGAVVTASNSDGTEAATPLAIGVQQVPYGESANANGVGLYFYPKAQYSESGVPFMLATAVVQSPNVGNINSIEIVDESGNLIADQYVTSGNSGVGAAPLTMGSVVQIVVPLPKGVNLSQNYKVRTSYQSAPSTLSTIAEKLGLANKQTQATSNQTTGTQVYTVTTQGNNINLQFTPNQVYLTGKNPVQYGYLYNIGDLTASQIQVSSSSPNVRVTAADQILNGQRVIKVTYELINTTVAPASNIVTVTAQNPAGQTQTSTGGTNQNVNPLPVPTPNPSPTPTPSPSPSPTPGPGPSPGPTPSPSHQYLFVVGGTGGEGSSVLRCELNTSTGAVTSCNVTPDAATWFTPSYMAFVSLSGNDYAYVNDGGSIYLCSVTADKNLENCNMVPLDNVPKGPQYMAMNVTEVNGLPYLYTGIVSGYPENYSIYKCPINNDASLGTCENVGFDTTLYGQQESALSLISNMEFVDINNTKYIYMTSALAYSPSGIIPFPGWTGVLRCDVNSSGMLINCTNFTSTQDIGTSYGLGFNSSGSDLYSYVGSYDSLYYCPVNAASGDLGSCTATPSSHSAWKPNSINFKNMQGVTYGYVVNSNDNNLEYCTLNSNGSLNVCTVTSPPEFPSWTPVAIFVQTIQ